MECFLLNKLFNSIIQVHECWILFIIRHLNCFESHFWCEKVTIMSLCSQSCYVKTTILA